MARIPTPPAVDPTLEAAAAALEETNKLGRPRPYLGMSAVGMNCERFLWLNFRWAGPAGGGFDAKALCNFADGHAAEDVMAERLRMVPGVELYTVDPSTGRQFGFTDLGGHFRGHIDGAIRGLIQAPKAWHVWEHKSSEKVGALLKAKADKGEKQALAAWSATYHAQGVLYMHYGQMERHYLTCSSPGGRMPWASVRTNADPTEAQRLIDKAERVIFAPEPLARLSDDPAHWKCKGCPMAPQCHGEALPPVNCRTCLHATPEREGDGRWTCAKWGSEIPLSAQAEGCGEHRFVPALLKRWGEAVDASEAENWVEYRAADGMVFRNGPWGVTSYTSKELAAASPALLRDAEFQAIRAKYQGQIVEREPFPGDKEAA